MQNINEDLSESCRAIVNALSKETKGDARKLMYADFMYKFKKYITSKDVSNEVFDGEKEKIDFIIFTIIPIEFEILSKILGFAQNGEKEDGDINGLWFYKTQIERRDGKRPLDGIATLVGRAGDVNCSIACSRFLQKFECDISILCGIAAGNKTEITKYSTVIASSIVNYEFQRIEEDGITFRPRIFNVDDYSIKTFPKIYLNEFENIWKESFNKTHEILEIDPEELPMESLQIAKLKDGTIASGAKLIADGKTLQNLRDQIPIEKGIIAAEMEGSGFSPACVEYQTKWLVFRGISDYGEDDKNDPLNKKYQKVAVASASTAMISYLRSLYRTPEELGEKDLDF